MVSTPPPSAPTQRHQWVDAVRGVVVTLVVLMHVGLYHFLALAEGTPSARRWQSVNDALQLVRMPALLVLSGWLMSSRVKAGLRSARTLHAIGANAYLYVLWLAIYAGIMSRRGTTDFAQAPSWETFWHDLVMPQSTLWFLAALAWYTAVLAASRSMPPALTIGVLAVVGWISTALWPADLGLWANIPHYAVFFAIGAHSGRAIEAIGRRPMPALAGSAAAAGVLWVLSLALTSIGVWAYPVTLGLSVTLVTMLFAAAAGVARYAGPVLRPAAWAGRRTLAVYVLHYPLLVVLATMSNERLTELNHAFAKSEAVNWSYPLVVTGILVGICLLVKEVADRTPLWWLFRLPVPTPAQHTIRPWTNPSRWPSRRTSARRRTR